MKLSRTRLFVSLSALFLLVSCSSVSKKEADHQIIPLAGNFQVHRYKLPNQLRLLVLEDHSSPTFAYQTWFRVGSRNEVPGKTGLAHLFEHMMFKGTKNYKQGEFDRLLESAGAQGENAFTSRDYTAYIQELPSSQLELIVKLEADRMVNLAIDDHSFATEREVVQNERRFRNENSPDGLMDQELFGIAFKNHPYHWPIIGYEQDLAKMKAKEAFEFYQAHYSPNQATVVVVGDVNPDRVYSLIQKYYGKIEPVHHQAKDHKPDSPSVTPQRKELKLNMQVEKLMVGYPVPPYMNEDIVAIQVLQTLLADGNSSRLHRALVETGIATSVDTYDVDNKDPGLLVFAVNLQKGKKAAEAEKVILKEFSRLTTQPVSKAELEKAQNKLDFAYYSGFTSHFMKSMFLGRYETITGNFEDGIRSHNKIQTISASDIKRVARKYLKPNTRNVITGVPKKS